MAKINWVFQNESGTHLNRYKATNVNTGEEIVFDLLRNANISIVGTPLNAEKLNELITAINGAWEELGKLGGLAYKDSLTKSDVGLGNVDNTSDLLKPISNATKEALDLKANSSSLGALAFKNSLGKSNVGLDKVDNTSDLDKPISTKTQTALDKKANTSDLKALAFRDSLSKTDVGLGNVDNTADADKSVKKATQDGDGNVISTTYAKKIDIPDVTNSATQTWVAQNYLPKTGGQVGSLTMENINGIYSNYGGIIGFNDEGQATIVNPYRMIAVGTNALDGDYNYYTFPEEEGDVLVGATKLGQVLINSGSVDGIVNVSNTTLKKYKHFLVTISHNTNISSSFVSEWSDIFNTYHIDDVVDVSLTNATNNIYVEPTNNTSYVSVKIYGISKMEA